MCHMGDIMTKHPKRQTALQHAVYPEITLNDPWKGFEYYSLTLILSTSVVLRLLSLDNQHVQKSNKFIVLSKSESNQLQYSVVVQHGF